MDRLIHDQVHATEDTLNKAEALASTSEQTQEVAKLQKDLSDIKRSYGPMEN